MDELTQLLKLANVRRLDESYSHGLEQLQEVVDASQISDIDDAIKRMTHCKKALAIVNKFKDPADRKKWRSATMVNMNKVRGALKRIEKQLMADNVADGFDDGISSINTALDRIKDNDDDFDDSMATIDGAIKRIGSTGQSAA